MFELIDADPAAARVHRSVPLSFCSAEEAAKRVGDPVIARAIQAAAQSQDDQAFHADNQRTVADE